MSNKEITGYLYRNGMWYETYKNHPKQSVSEEHMLEHYKTVVSIADQDGDKNES